MAFTPEQEAEIQKRILDLEGERKTLKESLDGGAKKADVEAATTALNKQIADLTAKIAAAGKPVKAAAGPDRDDPDLESAFFL